jgi:signal recognition particle receptor subunit beta
LHEKLLEIPLIIMMNKADLPGTIAKDNVAQILGKAKIKGDIIETSAINGVNVRKAFDLCVRGVISKYLDKDHS